MCWELCNAILVRATPWPADYPALVDLAEREETLLLLLSLINLSLISSPLIFRFFFVVRDCNFFLGFRRSCQDHALSSRI